MAIAPKPSKPDHMSSVFLTELLGLGTFSIVWYSREHDVSETGSVSETSCSLEYQTMEKFPKPGNSVCYTPSSEPLKSISFSRLNIELLV
jgi:hypothetical protein